IMAQLLPSRSNKIKMIGEYLPLIAFFVAYLIDGLITATIILVILSPLSVLVLWLLTRQIAWMPTIGALIAIIFGGLTIWLDDPRFIKLKPTIVQTCGATAMFVSLLINKPAIKYLFMGKLVLSEDIWRRITRNFGFFFIAMALLNELVWRSMSTEFWVYFKTFVPAILFMVFTIFQLYPHLSDLSEHEDS
ncbi:MAG: septation protein IspZ, partial [Pseudomonadota bacterium]